MSRALNVTTVRGWHQDIFHWLLFTTQARPHRVAPPVHAERYSTQPRTDINVQCTKNGVSQLSTKLSANNVFGELGEGGRLWARFEYTGCIFHC